ncbi:hypothetical protein ABOM_003093 [Aspergillus bombycis]|uniref:Uncharacterized protein n=1 Tax=Aspergillus bombycis TaxID=109264 RepID=A0A1F8AB93_9EURO|nr:hypothetical protein ABOM_003093 [Aspergillus bombycis]OGM48980.1 hypothetical protein ABOM_003093 [Aspergillus bombycis]
MSVRRIQNPGEVIEAIQSGRPTVIHYWDPAMGKESPLTPIFHSAAEGREGLDICIVDSGFIPLPHGPDERPLTVFYLNGDEEDMARSNPNDTEELFQRIEADHGL